jgi:hypothetical protein
VRSQSRVRNAETGSAVAARISEFNVSSESVMRDKNELVPRLSIDAGAIPTGLCLQTTTDNVLVQVCFVLNVPRCEDYEVVVKEEVYKAFGSSALQCLA